MNSKPLTLFMTLCASILASYVTAIQSQARYKTWPPLQLVTRNVNTDEALSRFFKQEDKNTFSYVKVNNTFKESQDFNYLAILKHPKRCSWALGKIGDYNEYKNYLDFVKHSSYQKKNFEWSLLFDSPLMPFPLRLKFKIPPIHSPGHYPFSFPRGFFKGLKGIIHIKKEGLKCHMAVEAFWKGQHTKISASILEFFNKALTDMGLNTLRRI